MSFQHSRFKRAVTGLLTAFAVSASLLYSSLPALHVHAEGGSCGDNATWSLSGGKLTISGTGTVTGTGWSGYSASITEVVIGNGITGMPMSSFNGCASLKKLTMPDTLTSLGTYFCYGCSALTDVTFSDKLTTVPAYAFYNCEKLGDLNLPDHLTTINKQAFANCIALTALTLPDSVTDIAEKAFYANNIKTLTLNSGLQTIGASAFNFSCFSSVRIPDTVKTIGANAFGYYYQSVYMKNGTCNGTGQSEERCTIIGASGGIAQSYATQYGHPFQASGSSGTHTHTGTWITDKAASCETAGSRHFVCTVCGETVTETLPALGHSWSDWKTEKAASCTEDGLESRTCSRCGEKETRVISSSGAHTWGAWKTVTAATCTKDGSESRTCTVCGETETRTVAALGHSWSDWKTDKAASCTEDGLESRTCSRCGEKETRVISSSGAHTWGAWKTVTAATCTKDGSESRTCTVCGETETRTVAALGHSWSDWKTDKAATCTEDGSESRTCSRCGEKEACTLAATGHSWGAWKTVTEPTLTAEGRREHTCVNCGEKQSEVIPMLAGYTVTVTAGAGGTVSPAGETRVAEGADLTITITPENSYQIAAVLVDGIAQSTNARLTLRDIRSAHTVTVTFAKTAVQQKPVCIGITVETKRDYWLDATAFDMADFTVTALILENGETAGRDITRECTPEYSPVMFYTAGMVGNQILDLLYQGNDTAIKDYLKVHDISVAVTMLMLGDCNFTGEIDAIDANMLQYDYMKRELLDMESDATPAQKAAMDVNADGQIDTKDAILILKYYSLVLVDFDPTWDMVFKMK